MAAVSNLPFYTTSYGENFGYNERDGTNTSSFRNRYLNEGYRGTAQLGPVRFAAARTHAEQDVPHLNATRPQTAALARTQQRPQQSLGRPSSASYTGGAAFGRIQPQQQRSAQFSPDSESYARNAAAQAAQSRSWELEQNRTSRYEQQAAAQAQGAREERYFDDPFAGQDEAPHGVYSVPVNNGPQRSQRLQQSFAPVPLQQARLAQSQAFGSSIEARYALPAPNAQPSVNASPYYVPPYEQPPSSSFAPSATALGNKTYQFDLDDPSRYAFSQSFRGVGPVSNKPAQDPGQSIPYGRLQAEDAADVRHRMSMASWDTFHVADRDALAAQAYNLEGIKTKQKLPIDPEHYCKWSQSRRLPVGPQMSYHISGYCGHVPTEKLRHGATYGKTTRLCLVGNPEGL